MGIHRWRLYLSRSVYWFHLTFSFLKNFIYVFLYNTWVLLVNKFAELQGFCSNWVIFSSRSFFFFFSFHLQKFYLLVCLDLITCLNDDGCLVQVLEKLLGRKCFKWLWWFHDCRQWIFGLIIWTAVILLLLHFICFSSCVLFCDLFWSKCRTYSKG